MEREIDIANHVHPDDEPPRMRHKKIENICQAVNKVIDVQLQNQHQVMDSERDRLLKQHFMDQMVSYFFSILVLHFSSMYNFQL